ncbi:MAG: hypothetical protein LBS42_11935 [Tannerella sp.]|jgi:hypothetical protein|nr:hypothetical protein [Tannerella sp.]
MRVFKCSACSKIHVEAGNVLIHFPSPERLRKFLDYLESIDADHYAALNRSRGLEKDIYLPAGDRLSVNMAFSVAEFEELKRAVRNYLAGYEPDKLSFAGLLALSKAGLN